MKPFSFLSALALACATWALPSFQDPAPAPQPPPLPTVGEAAPTFRLNAQDGVGVAIGGESDHWTVIAFYPKAATPG